MYILGMLADHEALFPLQFERRQTITIQNLQVCSLSAFYLEAVQGAALT